MRGNPSMERRVEAQTWLSLAATRVEIDAPVAVRAQGLVGLGYGPFDALHISAAESARADVLLTTDDRLLKRSSRKLGNPRNSCAESAILEQGSRSKDYDRH